MSVHESHESANRHSSKFQAIIERSENESYFTTPSTYRNKEDAANLKAHKRKEMILKDMEEASRNDVPTPQQSQTQKNST